MLVALATGSLGLLRLAAYDGTPANSGSVPTAWPSATELTPARARPTVLMFVHPHCPCTLASVEQLLEVLERQATTATLVVFEPAAAPTDWSQGALLRLAAAYPQQLQIVRDPAGQAARCFQANTSGICLVYGPDHRLRYAGGVTLSRGHRGANEGLRALERLLADPASAAVPVTFPVYGCSLIRSAQEE